MITIENATCKAAIRTRGAELASLIHSSSGREYIWQADPAVWGGSAPILFPVIGKLKNGRTDIDGQAYAIPKHGVLRSSNAVCIQNDDDRAVFQFRADEETRAVYPFEFSFTADFHLLESGLAVTYTIQNTDKKPMLFSVGSHPAFALDLESRALTDYTIEFSKPESLDLYGLIDGMLTKRTDAYLEQENTIRLTETLFEEDALIFQDIRSRSLRIPEAGITIDIRNNPHLGIWAKPGAPYVCHQSLNGIFSSTSACNESTTQKN